MKSISLIAGALMLVAVTPAAPTVATAAELGIPSARGYVVKRHRHARYRGCASGRYTCYPLYGAYGPWGGRSYWAAYTGGQYLPWRRW
ncbi:MAG: hypothetical protein J0H62_04335 [Rhizobiales bacterium]|nr:hypothetical protein [Hyphomicrobiales bacterium]